MEDRCLLSASLVKDINPFTVGSNPQNLTDVNGTLFFTANDSSGFELWKTDGTADGTALVKTFASNPYAAYFTNVNGKLFFSATDPANGAELWESDGTDAGTHIVKDIRPGSAGSSPLYLTNVNGELFFTADDGVHGRELWKSDGTDAGTVLVSDIYAGPGSSSPLYLTNVNGELFFSADDGVNGRELWKSDGTAAGTVLVKDIYPGSTFYYYGEDGQYIPNSSNPMQLTNVNGTLFFSADDGVHGRELWKSDGTDAGTVLVKDIKSGSGSSNPGQFTNVNGTLYFAATDTSNVTGLWKSDGTEAGTVLVSAAAAPGFLTNVNGTLFFRTVSGSTAALWKSDGTTAGTVFVKNIPLSGAPDNPMFTSVNGTLFFSAVNATGGGFNLWKSDGTAAGTTIVTDAIQSWDLTNLTPFAGKLYFASIFHGLFADLWSSDGSAAGTGVVKLLNPKTMGSNPTSLTDVNGTLFFSADDGIHGQKLWKSDGTEAGTVLVKDVKPGSANSFPQRMTNVNGTLFFVANFTSTSFELWKSDGTEAGTVLLKTFSGGINPNTGPLVDANGTLFFTVYVYPDRQLWKSDGTPGGTVLVKDLGTITYDYGISSQALVSVNGTVFFAAADQANGWELWESDGTATGTHIVKDINPGSGSSSPRELTNVNGTLYFTANDGVNWRQLYKTDGTEAGTVLVTIINPGAGNGLDFLYASLTNVNGTLFFVAKDGAQGYQLWKSDGTESGTALVKEIGPVSGYYPPAPGNLVNVNGELFFTATDSVHGTKLWKSDGTEAGTVIVSDTVSGGSELVNGNGTLYFLTTAIVDGHYQTQVWQSDGTAAGTFSVFSPGPGATYAPSHLTRVNNKLFFAADDGSHGDELWMIGLNDVAPPAVQSMVVNDGSASRANVKSLTVTFTTVVTLSPGALEVQRQDLSDVGLDVSTSVVSGKTVAVITFTGDDIIDGSLPDGNYVLTVHKDLVHDCDGQTMTQDATLSFFRAAPPIVVSTVLNDGAPQNVTSVTVTFSTTVTLGAGALEVQRADQSDVGISVSTSVVDGHTVAVITFTGSDLVNGSLPDGSYQLFVHKDLVHDAFGQPMDQDATFNFFRQGVQTQLTITSVLLNAGDTTGAQVHSITFSFSDLVTLDVSAFDLYRSDGTKVGLVLTTSVVNGKAVAVLTFTGADLIDGALPDGSYTIVVHGNAIHNSQGQALGGAFAGDNAADFFGADGSGQGNLVNLFHPFP